MRHGKGTASRSEARSVEVLGLAAVADVRRGGKVAILAALLPSYPGR